MKLPLSPRTPYRKVGNIFNRTECQFSKKKYNNIIHVKDRMIKKYRSENKFNIKIKSENHNIDGEEYYNLENLDKIKRLEGENLYLKNMIKLSEEKLSKRENQLEQLLTMHNRFDNETIPNVKEFQINDSKFLDIIKDKENINHNNINKISQTNRKHQKRNIFDGIILYDYLDEPLEQVAPKPYNLKYIK
jgi:hypothetical protein